MATPKRILITRLSHIGDCVLTLPLADALKREFPDAQIAWAVEKPSHQLLANHPAVDQLIQIPRGWLKSPRQIFRIREQLRGSNFDLCLDPQGLTKSSLLGWLSGAKQRIGFSRGWSGELAPWTYTDTVTPSEQHIVRRQLELLKPLGCAAPIPQYFLPVDPEALIRADEMILQLHLGCGFAVVNPSASWPSKRWEPDGFGVVAKRLGQQFGITSLVVWAGKEEHSLAKKVVATSGGQALLAPPTTLPQLAALALRARLFLSSDSGPLHIAAAVGTPCVGLYGPTKPEHCGAFGAQHTNLQAWYQEGSRKARRRAENDAMRDLSVEVVVDACQKILRDTQLRRTA